MELGKTPESHRPTPELDALALASMHLRDHDEMVAYRTDGGVDVMRFIETGEVRVETWQAGGRTMAFERLVKEPLLDASFASLADYIRTLDVDYLSHTSEPTAFYTFEHESKYDDVKQVLLEAAAETAASLPDTDRFEACRRDCVEGSIISDCDCVSRGDSSYTDVSGHTIKSPEAGLPDPNCDDCGGFGLETSQCYGCKGSGHTLVNPLVSIINNQTGEEAVFRFEVARLLAEGEITMDIRTEPQRRVRGQPKAPELFVGLNFTEYIGRQAASVGIDIKEEKFYTYWGPEPMETWGTTFGHLLRPVSSTITAPSEFESLTAFGEAAILSLQTNAQRTLRDDIYGIDWATAQPAEIKERGRLFDLVFNDDLTVAKYGLRLDKTESSYDALQELITTLDSYNYRLGFTYTGIATGETGPALYVLDAAGNAISQIDCGYEEAMVLENARRRVRTAHENGNLNT